jgi:hypothetical protein
MTSQVQLTPPRAAKNGAAGLPAFLKDGSLVTGRADENLWTAGDSELWLAPHPYQGRGERKITYAEAVQWLKQDNPFGGQEQLLASKGVYSGDPAKRELECRWADEGMALRRRAALELDYFYENVRCRYSFSDEEVLDFVCSAIVDYEDQLRALFQKEAEAGNEYVNFGSRGVLIAARAVAARARWNGLKATPTDQECLDENQYRREPLLLNLPGLAGFFPYNRREPLLLDLPGLAGFFPYTDKQLLSAVCSFIYALQQEIFDSILPNTSGRQRLLLAQAMAFVEQDQDREDAVDTELSNLRHDELSKWQRTVKETCESLNHLHGSTLPLVVPMREKVAA